MNIRCGAGGTHYVVVYSHADEQTKNAASGSPMTFENMRLVLSSDRDESAAFGGWKFGKFAILNAFMPPHVAPSDCGRRSRCRGVIGLIASTAGTRVNSITVGPRVPPNTSPTYRCL